MSEILFQCKISGRARSKKNSKQLFKNKITGKMFISTSDLFKKWSIFAACHINRAKNKETIDYPCNLSVKAFYSNKKHQQDLDNVIASVCDVLEDCGVIKNDNLFYSYDGSKKVYYSDQEYIIIEITRLNLD